MKIWLTSLQWDAARCQESLCCWNLGFVWSFECVSCFRCVGWNAAGWLVGLFLVEVGNLPFALVCQTMLCPCLGFAKCLEMLCPHEEETLNSPFERGREGMQRKVFGTSNEYSCSQLACCLLICWSTSVTPKWATRQLHFYFCFVFFLTHFSSPSLHVPSDHTSICHLVKPFLITSSFSQWPFYCCFLNLLQHVLLCLLLKQPAIKGSIPAAGSPGSMRWNYCFTCHRFAIFV